MRMCATELSCSPIGALKASSMQSPSLVPSFLFLLYFGQIRGHFFESPAYSLYTGRFKDRDQL